LTFDSAPPVKPEPILEVRNLRKYFPIQKGLLKRTIGLVRAVDDVSFTVNQGETVSLVGESGCGKTTTARCVLRAIEPTAGEILFRTGKGSVVDLAALSQSQIRPLRRDVQLVFQDPFGSLNPRMTIFEIISEPLLVNGIKDRRRREERVAELLQLVGLRAEYMSRYPHAFSGGQRQRVGIARALALNPRLIVADEPVSALDVSVKAQVLNLMMDLQDEFGLTYLFVSHDLSVVSQISDRVIVMYVGLIVEEGSPSALFNAPRHPYTAALLSAIPNPDPDGQGERVVLSGEVANSANPPSGCYFNPRCPFAVERCRTEVPTLRELEPGRLVRCHRADELELMGAA
jgi:peptide/nickel transport system ATP-binding protein